MPQDIVYLHTLKPDVDPANYENWVREVDYPLTRRQPGVLSYEVTRLDSPVPGAPPIGHHYLEIIRVEDPDEYRRNAQENPEFKAMLAAWGEFVADCVGAVGVPI